MIITAFPSSQIVASIVSAEAVALKFSQISLVVLPTKGRPVEQTLRQPRVTDFQWSYSLVPFYGTHGVCLLTLALSHVL